MNFHIDALDKLTHNYLKTSTTRFFPRIPGSPHRSGHTATEQEQVFMKRRVELKVTGKAHKMDSKLRGSIHFLAIPP